MQAAIVFGRIYTSKVVKGLSRFKEISNRKKQDRTKLTKSFQVCQFSDKKFCPRRKLLIKFLNYLINKKGK